MKPRKLLAKNHLFTTIGILLTISGLVALYIGPILMDHIINTEFTLTPKSKTYEIWAKVPIPLAIDFYLFNWTNPEDIANFSTKPHLVQLGPYRFRESSEKVDIIWNANNTVTFKQLKNWYFDAKFSNGSLDDQVTTLNAVTVTAAFQARKFSYVMKRALSITLSGLIKDIHITKSVGQLLFEGYPDPLIDMVKSMPSLAGIKIPPFDKFGWFYMRNGSTDFNGVLNMATGRGKTPLGVLERWNSEPQTEFFEGQCGKVRGSAGEFFPQHRTKDMISMFSPDMCRNIEFDYEEETEVHDIVGYKYVGGPRMVDNGTLYPENECFCNGECVPSGVLNASSCRYGSPGFISFPHFYGADPFYLNQVDGLNPIQDIHQFHIILEPRTGIPLDVAARFQINILMQPIEDISFSQDLPKIFFPMIWFEQRATISDDLAAGLQKLLSLPLIGTSIAITLIVTGLATLVGVGVLYLIKHFKNVKQKKHIKHELSKEEVPLNDSKSNIKIHSNH